MNALASSGSVYLRSHADDPVDWKEYGEAALETARTSGKLLLLSIGYSACHWCHVMALETFSKPQVASYLNDHFVCVKIDREERPDLDSYYMEAVIAQQGGGGWPLTVFAREDGTPIYGATYLPPRGSGHSPGLLDVAERLVELKELDPAALNAAAMSFEDHFRAPLPDHKVDLSALDTNQAVASALSNLSSHMDREFYGFGSSPKFPQAYLLRSLWEAKDHPDAVAVEDFVLNTLRALGQGGIFDHLEGGFFRYSTDRFFMVPHFEKMLIDQADICDTLAVVAADSGDPDLHYLARRTIEFTVSTLIRDDGLMATSIDADFEGVEGGYYLFPPDEIIALSPKLAEFYGVAAGGTYDGMAIPHRPRGMSVIPPQELNDDISTLVARRHARGALPRDDKALCHLNARWATVLSRAARFLGESEWANEALRLSLRITESFLGPDGSLVHSLSQPSIGAPQFSDDYISFAALALENFSVTGDAEWLAHASVATDITMSRFASANPFGLNISDADNPLVQDRLDGAHASTLTRAITVLSDLSSLTGQDRYLDFAKNLTESLLAHDGITLPSALAAHRFSKGMLELAVPGIAPSKLRSLALATTLPSLVLAQGEGTTLTNDRAPGLAYLCRNRVCGIPISDPDTFNSALLAIREQMFS